MSFWDKAKERTLKHSLRQTISLANSHNPDLTTKHPDEVRDLNLDNPNLVRTKKRLKEEMEKHTLEVERREKNLGKRR